VSRTVAVVTGGAGFIGSHLVDRLIGQGWEVRVIDNFSTGFRANLADAPAATVIAADLREPGMWADACLGADVLFHLAALPSVQRSVEDPLTTHEVNVTGTVHVLDAARRAGVRRVVIASSSSVYGQKGVGARVESATPAPVSPYGVSKLAAEAYGLAYAATYGMSVVALRFFNVYGPRQDPLSEYSAVIPRFVSAILADQSPIVYGDGSQSRDFTHVSDVVAGLCLAADSDAVGCYNIAGGRQTTLLQLLDHISGITGTDISPRFAEPRAGDIRESLADISRARAELGFSPSVAMVDGLRTVIEFIRQRPGVLR
jgi:UDP-glucose 4-epimerase